MGYGVGREGRERREGKYTCAIKRFEENYIGQNSGK